MASISQHNQDSNELQILLGGNQEGAEGTVCYLHPIPSFTKGKGYFSPSLKKKLLSRSNAL